MLSLLSLRYPFFLFVLASLMAACGLTDSPKDSTKRPSIAAGYHPPTATTTDSLATLKTGADVVDEIRKEPWTEKELMPAASMLAQINGYLPPVTFDIGSAGTIRMARKIGPVEDEANLEKFRKALKSIPKDQPVVVYCGCCPFESCPNIRPAFNLLKAEGFTRPRILNIPQNLKVDWIDQGYPMEVTPDQYGGAPPRTATPPTRSQSTKKSANGTSAAR